MAALTAATTNRESLGSATLMTFTFTSVVTGDTFASGLGTNVIGNNFWYQMNSITTQASAGVGATWSGSTVTFTLGEDNTAVNLIVLSRS